MFKILRRHSGDVGAPLDPLPSGVFAWNGVDYKLYYGHGDDGAGFATNNVQVGVLNPAPLNNAELTGYASLNVTAGSDYGKFTSGGTFGTSSNNFAAINPGISQGEKVSYTFYSSFMGTTDSSPKRTADITAGFNSGNWGTEYLTFNVGYNGADNTSKNNTIERMRIDGSGNVLIGTSTTDGSKLQIRKDQNSATSISLTNSNSGDSAASKVILATGTSNSSLTTSVNDNSANPYVKISSGSGISNAYFDMPNFNFRNVSGTNLFTVDASGNVVSKGTATHSDILTMAGSLGSNNKSFDFYNSTAISSNLRFKLIGTSSDADGGHTYFQHYSDTGTYNGLSASINRSTRKWTFSVTPVVGTVSTSDNSTSAASTAYVQNNLANYSQIGHTQAISTVTGLQTALDSKQDKTSLLTSFVGLTPTNGSILIGTGSTAVSKLDVGTSGQVLTVAGGLPTWSTPNTDYAPTNHTQAISTITGLQTALDGKQSLASNLTSLAGLSLTTGSILYASSNSAINKLAIGTEGQILMVNGGALGWTTPETITIPVTSVAGKTGTVTLVKGDVGLGNVDNTSDASKPVSTATQTALNTKMSLGGGTFTGKVAFSASTTSNSSLNIVSGVAPSTPADGDIWRTSTTFYGKINGTIAGFVLDTRSISAGTGLTGGGDLTSNKTLSFDTTWGDARYLGISANAVTSTKWATGRTISLTGDLTGTSGSIDGSANVSFATTLATVNSNVGSFGGTTAIPVITVNGKGLITAVSTASISSDWSAITNKPTTIAGFGITDAPTKAGIGAVGLWGINVTGNAGTATALATPRTINGTSFNGSVNIDTTEWIHSQRDFADGTIITTSIDYSQANGSPWLLEIRGNSFGGGALPFDVQAQGYIYNGSIIYVSGVSNGTNITGMVALNVGGLLTFWFPRQAYWQGFNVKCLDVLTAGRNTNKVTAISNGVKPTGTKEVDISSTIVQSVHSSNLNTYAALMTNVKPWDFANNRQMSFSFWGYAGQPQYLWGTNDGISVNVWNPSNFNVASASTWTTGRTLSLTGDITGTSGTINGSANVSFATTLATVNSNVGSFGSTSTIPSFTVDAKGRITAASSNTPSGTWGISISGNAATATNTTYITSIDTRDTTTTPESINAGALFEFKNNATEGLSDGGAYFGSFTYRQWGIGADWSGGLSHQLGFTDNANIWHRHGSGTAWGAWKEIVDSSNIGSFAPSLTGTGASGTWGISISGSAASVAGLTAYAGHISGNYAGGNQDAPDNVIWNGLTYQSGFGSSLFGQNDGAMYSQAYNTNYVHQIAGDYRTGQMQIRGKNGGTWQAWRTVLDSSNYSTYVPASTMTTQTFTATSNQTVFTLGTAIVTSAALVFLNGIALKSSDDYTLTTTTLTLTTGATLNDEIRVVSISAYNVAYANALVPANNLSDLSSAATARTNLGLGTVSTLNTGTSANNIPQLDASARLPAVDGSQLTNVTALKGGTRVTCSGQTSIEFTGIPSTAKRISLYFQDFSTSTTGSGVLDHNPMVKWSNSSTYPTNNTWGSVSTLSSQYSFCMLQQNKNGAYLAGYLLASSSLGWDSNYNLNGKFEIINVGNTHYEGTWIGGLTNYASTFTGAYHCGATLANVDRVMITTTNGTSTFDNGSITIYWE